MVINDAEYDQDIIKSQILTQKSIRDNLKDEETTKDNLNVSLNQILTLIGIKLYLR